MSEKGVGQKIMWGAVWSIFLNVAMRGLGLISIMVLARLITPYDLGVYAAAAIIVELIHVLTDVGIYPVLIHRKNPDASFYQTAWTVQVVRGIIIFLVVQVMAEYFIYLYSDDEAVREAIRVTALAVLISGFSSIYLVNFQKEMDFKGLMRFQMICRLIGFFATIIAAYILQSFWALVIGNLVSAVARLVLSHLFSRGPHRITFKSSGELLNVSRWVLVHEIASFISLKADTFLITRFLGPQTLGIYEVGYQVVMAPTQEIALPVSRALFPGLAKLQENKDKFTEVFTISLASILYLVLPAGVGLIMVADFLVASLFPENWHGAAEVVQSLAVFGVFRAFFGPCVSALMGGGHMALNARLTLLNALLRVSVLAYGLLSYGLDGLMNAIILVAAVQVVIYVSVMVRKEMLILSHLVNKSWRAFAAAAMMAAVLAVLFGNAGVMRLESSAAALLASIAIGGVVYFVMVFGVWFVSGRPSGIEEILYTRIARYLP